MVSRSKAEEVRFYSDRSQEALITVIKSIMYNPRLNDAERIDTLRAIEEHHRMIADFIQQRICDGERKGYEMAGAGSPTGVVAG